MHVPDRAVLPRVRSQAVERQAVHVRARLRAEVTAGCLRSIGARDRRLGGLRSLTRALRGRRLPRLAGGSRAAGVDHARRRGGAARVRDELLLVGERIQHRRLPGHHEEVVDRGMTQVGEIDQRDRDRPRGLSDHPRRVLQGQEGD